MICGRIRSTRDSSPDPVENRNRRESVQVLDQLGFLYGLLDGGFHRKEHLSDDESVIALHLDENQFTKYATLEVQIPHPIFRQNQEYHADELSVREEYRPQGMPSNLFMETESRAQSKNCDFLMEGRTVGG